MPRPKRLKGVSPLQELCNQKITIDLLDASKPGLLSINNKIPEYVYTSNHGSLDIPRIIKLLDDTKPDLLSINNEVRASIRETRKKVNEIIEILNKK